MKPNLTGIDGNISVRNALGSSLGGGGPISLGGVSLGVTAGGGFRVAVASVVAAAVRRADAMEAFAVGEDQRGVFSRIGRSWHGIEKFLTPSP